MLDAGGLPRTPGGLRQLPRADLPELAAIAAQQWTATFNPRAVGEAELLAIYRRARL